jgi:hypothetical protein
MFRQLLRTIHREFSSSIGFQIRLTLRFKTSREPSLKVGSLDSLMKPSFRIRTLLSDTWHTTYANPSLLVCGLIISLLVLWSFQFSFLETELLKNGPLKDTLSLLPLPLLLLFLLIFFAQAFASSQIFLLSAAEFLRRPNILTLRSRLIKAFAYVGVEILGTIPIIVVSPIIFIPTLLPLEPTHPLSLLATSFLFGIFFVVTLFTTILKRLTIGYLILSPLGLRSSLHLASQIFFRYRFFSILSFLLVLLLTLLFTILENLVMLQSAFIGQYLSGIAPGVLMYSVLLLANTFMSVFTEVFWLHFFLTLTNKNQKRKDPVPLLHKQLEEVPLIPS